MIITITKADKFHFRAETDYYGTNISVLGLTEDEAHTNLKAIISNLSKTIENTSVKDTNYIYRYDNVSHLKYRIELKQEFPKYAYLLIPTMIAGLLGYIFLHMCGIL